VEIRGPKGKGYRAYHLEPGQTMTLVFSKSSKADPATGISETTQVPFWCDIHQHMKGEFLVVETKGEVGGG
jgi:putative component of toxin-antitoxin plasmid stabilization module